MPSRIQLQSQEVYRMFRAARVSKRVPVGPNKNLRGPAPFTVAALNAAALPLAIFYRPWRGLEST